MDSDLNVNDLHLDPTPAEPEVSAAPQDDYDGADMQGAPRIVVPKPISNTNSYANAYAAQRNAGRAARPVSRAPQVLVKKPTAEELKAAEAARLAQIQAAQKKQKQTGQAIVKGVLSGDTLLLRLPAPAGTIPPEKTMALSGINAPRFGRGKNAKDEPFAWESREFLRKKALGQVIEYTIAFTSPQGRDIGTVKLNGENLAAAVVAAGFANVAPGTARKDGSLHPERQALVELKEKAEQEGVGMWAKEVDQKQHTRTVEVVEANARALFEKAKNTELPAIIDQVRDGSTLRVELVNPDGSFRHKQILLHLAGVQCPRFSYPRQNQKSEEESGEEKKAPAQPVEAEPGALAARDFVEQRLLHRDVNIRILGVDKSNNFFGAVVFSKGNITLELLRHGHGKFIPWSAALTGEADQLREAERSAQAGQLNIWRTQQPVAAPAPAPVEVEEPQAAGSNKEKLSGTVNSQTFDAKVVQIVSGDSVVLQDRNNTTRRFALSSVIAPRLPNLRSNNPEQQKGQPWAAEAKEFVRKKLIGKKVRVHVDYTRPGPAETKEPPRAHVTILQAKSNIAEQLVENGLATVIQHRVEDPRSSHYDALLAAEEKARAAKVGMHSGRAPKTTPVVDLTEKPRAPAADAAADGEVKEKQEMTVRQLSGKAKQYLPFLQKESNLKGVIEFVFSGTRSKVFIPSQNCFISFVLSGVRCPSSRGKEAEPFAEESVRFARNLLSQQDVRIAVEGLDKGDNFLGTMHLGAKNIALLLLEEGLASVFGPSADRSPLKDELYATEAKAKEKKLNIWKNWTPPKDEPKTEETKTATEEAPLSEKERLVNVTVTEIVDPGKFYVQIVGDEAVNFIQEEMKRFGETQGAVPAPTDFAPKKGLVCAGQFEEEWFRVRIDKRASDTEFEVSFVDYGNTDVLDASLLRPITNPAVKQVRPLAHLCTLAGLKAPHSESDHYEVARDAFYDMVWGKQLLAKVLLRDAALHVILHDSSSPTSINQQLLREGLVRIRSRPDRRLRGECESMKADEQQAQRERLGLWEFGVVSDPEEEDLDTSFGPRKRE